MRAAVRLIERLSEACGALAALLVLALIALMTFEVVMRYVFSAPTIWSYEVSTWTMGAAFVLAIGYALRSNAHVRIDLLHALLGPRARPAIDLAGHLFLMLPALVWITAGLWDYFADAWRTGETSGQSAWNPQVWHFRFLLFLGFLVFTLQVVAEIAKAALGLAGRDPSDA